MELSDRELNNIYTISYKFAIKNFGDIFHREDIKDALGDSMIVFLNNTQKKDFESINHSTSITYFIGILKNKLAQKNFKNMREINFKKKINHTEKYIADENRNYGELLFNYDNSDLTSFLLNVAGKPDSTSRKIIEEYYFEKKEDKEIAKDINSTTKYVKSRKYVLKKEIRNRILKNNTLKNKLIEILTNYPELEDINCRFLEKNLIL